MLMPRAPLVDGRLFPFRKSRFTRHGNDLRGRETGSPVSVCMPPEDETNGAPYLSMTTLGMAINDLRFVQVVSKAKYPATPIPRSLVLFCWINQGACSRLALFKKKFLSENSGTKYCAALHMLKSLIRLERKSECRRNMEGICSAPQSLMLENDAKTCQ